MSLRCFFGHDWAYSRLEEFPTVLCGLRAKFFTRRKCLRCGRREAMEVTHDILIVWQQIEPLSNRGMGEPEPSRATHVRPPVMTAKEKKELKRKSR